MTGHVIDGEGCVLFDRAMELLARRWVGAIVRVLLDRPQRFSEIRRRIPGLTDRMLSQRLKELEAEALVEREVTADVPVRITYALSSAGRDLDHVIEAIERWAHIWMRDAD